VDEHILRTGQRCFVVSSDGRIDGLVTLHQVKAIPRDRWGTTPVEQAMTPLADLTVVLSDTPIAEVLQTMESRDIAQVPVIESGRFLGMITRDHLLRVLSAKMELASPS
jgi:CBS domain-containing protein